MKRSKFSSEHFATSTTSFSSGRSKVLAGHPKLCANFPASLRNAAGVGFVDFMRLPPECSWNDLPCLHLVAIRSHLDRDREIGSLERVFADKGALLFLGGRAGDAGAGLVAGVVGLALPPVGAGRADEQVVQIIVDELEV